MQKSLAQISSDIYFKKTIYTSSQVFCAISGGQDSQFLFYIVLHFKQYCHLNVAVVYMHHFWQHSNFQSFLEIWKLCFLFKIPFITLLTEKTLLTEEEARNWRNTNFFHIANFYNFSNILVAHTKSDVVETAVWNLVRGTSPMGLTSFKYKKLILKPTSTLSFLQKSKFKKKTISSLVSKLKINNDYILINCNRVVLKKILTNKIFQTQSIDCTQQLLINSNLLKNKKRQRIRNQVNKIVDKQFYLVRPKSNGAEHLRLSQGEIIRPLFDYYRQDITTLLKILNLPVNPDPTNKNEIIIRNKIRNTILPHWRKNFQYLIDENISSFLTINSNEQKFLKNLLLKISHENFSSKIFDQLPESIQKKFLHWICEAYTGRQMNSRSLTQIHMLIRNFNFLKKLARSNKSI